MANFVLVPVIGNISTITASLVAQYGVAALSRPNSTTSQNTLVAYTSSTTFEPVYSFWYNDNSYNYPLPCFVSLTNNSYRVAKIDNGSSAAPSTSNINNTRNIDGVSCWFSAGYANTYGWWLESLSAATPYNSIEDGIRDILTNTSYVSISHISGVVSVAAPKLALEGSIVTVYLTMPTGVTVNESDISVTKNGASISFTYDNGVLTFTA